MCGVCGLAGPWADSLESGYALEAMLERLAHRGPDAQGFMQRYGLRLAHARLAVLDPEGGTQPVSGGTAVGRGDLGGLALVCNGQIYNHDELRQELTGLGHVFRTRGDAEVLLAAWSQWGTDALTRLNGMFALAVHDARRGRLHLAVDAFGIKPLVWTLLPGRGLAFASEAKALLSLPDVRAVLNRSALAEYLTFQFTLGESLFSGIHRLPPGGLLTIDLTAPAPDPRLSFWRESWPDVPEFSGTPEDAAAELRLLLDDALRLQSRSDVPVGCLLSGGLDSSCVAAFAVRSGSIRPSCFTGRFAEGPAYDESHHARAVTDFLGLESHVITPGPEDFQRHLPRLMYLMDEPAAGPGLFSQYMTAGLAASGVAGPVKVLLSGLGGDELFSGYARHLIILLEHALTSAILTPAPSSADPTLADLAPVLPALAEYLPLLRRHLSSDAFTTPSARYFSLLDRGRDLDSIFTPDVYSPAIRRAVLSRFVPIFDAPGPRHLQARLSRVDRLTLLPALLHVEDRTTMAHSLESRVPLLDIRIADFAVSLAPRHLLHAGLLKSPLRLASASLLPSSILNRRDKMGFPTPFAPWAAGLLHPWLRDLLLAPSARTRPLCDVKGVAGLLDGLTSGGLDQARKVWAVLCLELWMQAFGVSVE